MSGLVQRLIARSREPVTGIRPRPASLYEDHPPMSRAQAEPPALFDAPDPAPAARPPGVPATRLQRPTAREVQAYEEHEIQVERSPREPGEARRERTPPVTGPDVADPAVAVGAARSERRAPAAPPLPGLAEAGRAPGAPLLRVAAGPVLAAPARPSRAQAAQAAQDAPAPPVVEISIGRLEVRAPQAQAAPQARPPRKDHASVLQAYLRGRSKGELA
ncbi:hypothetical protein AB0392_57255 [Nonomuraea angiospora]|uniref:hypothetical protein n=1 Tax=Nonomuraea angiospora TaxID=46172 RepID=UPI00344E341C